MKKFLAIILSGLLTIGCFCSCSDGNKESYNKPVQKLDTIHFSADDIKETDKNIIYYNNSDYQILISPNASSEIIKASDELKMFISEATDFVLPVTTVAEENKKYISLGKTSLAKQNDISATYNQVGVQGYIIKTVGDNIFIDAYQDIGVIYGVYGFLEIMLNYDFFYTDVYTIDHTSVLKFYEMNVIEVPDMDYRISSFGFQKDNVTTRTRMRLTYYASMFPSLSIGGSWHNCFGYIDPEIYLTEHPEWYNDAVTQLCYTAHGDTESRDAMIQLVADTIVELFDGNDFNETVFALNDEDMDSCCSCSACVKDKNKYGTWSSSLILFLNKTAKIVEQRLKDIGDPRAETFRIVFYAYHYLMDAPVVIKEDQNGNYILNGKGEMQFEYDKDMVLNDHVTALYCPSGADYPQGFMDKANKKFQDILYKWTAISKNIHIWEYDSYFVDGGWMIPYNTYYTLQELYQFAYENNVRWFYPEAQGANDKATAFSLLKAYLYSKLGWNIYADVDILINKFFKAMYGTKSDLMYQFFNEITVLETYHNKVLGHSGYMQASGHFKEKEYWPQNLVLKWVEDLENAQKELQLEGDTVSAANIRLEEISPLYILIRMYSLSFTTDELYVYKSRIRDYLYEANIKFMYQGQSRDAYLSSLGF